MKRRLNFTARKRISLERVSFSLIEYDGTKSFDMRLSLEGLELPEHANIYVEAYHKTDYMRYSFGAVGRFSRPESTDLGSLGRIENLHFRVKIVDESGRRGLILAEVDRIRVQAPAQLRSILPVEFRDDLGNQVWRLSFDDEPVLELNSAIPFIRDKAKTDYRLFFYIYPAMLREILVHMVLLDGIPDVEDAEEWERNWLEFATHYGGDPPEVLDRHSGSFDEVQVKRWVKTVVTEFCTSHADKWGNFIQLEERET